MCTKWLLVPSVLVVVLLPMIASAQTAAGTPETSGSGPRFAGYFYGNENGCPNGGAIYATGDPAVHSFVCNGLNAKDATFSSFEEAVGGLPCTLPNGTQKAIKVAISKTGAVSLNCGDPPRYVDNEDGTVTDLAKGLIWLKNANCFGLLDYTTEALPAVAALADGTCGLTDGSMPGDWRLPLGEEFLRVTRAAAQLGCTGSSRISLTDDSGFGCYGDGSGSSFVGVLPGPYLGAGFSLQPGSLHVPLFSLTFGGELTTFPYSVSGYVWPVRNAKP